MKKKASKVNDMLDELATTIEDKILASKKLKQAEQETAKLRNSLEEPAQKTDTLLSDAQIARTQVLQIVEKVEHQETVLKSLQPAADNTTTFAKNSALLKKKIPPL